MLLKNSVDRFILSYTRFIGEYKKGNVYVSKKDINKIFELLESDDDDCNSKFNYWKAGLNDMIHQILILIF